MPHTATDCVRAIYRDCDLLRTLRVHLQSLDPDELADAVATAAQQETDDDSPESAQRPDNLRPLSATVFDRYYISSGR
ncbi:hypothetical protein MRB53_023182 [Persea americana]|uniref:Uncharacterized protein n=1 Tax=Persea americana TaxID=3435 RepID=A0ACC2L8Q0_PERAE|nr:hypothetical protein MRB53_023182 [Persea americana]